MKKKAFFTFLIVAFLSVYVFSETNRSGPKVMATLSYSLPSKLDWTQSTDDELAKDMQVYTLGDENPIQLFTAQVGNTDLWEQTSPLNEEQMFDEIVAGKKVVHKAAGYKNWTASKSLNRKSDKEIIFEVTGNYEDGKEKKYFSEKYYVTPYGYIVSSLDWSAKSDAALAEKAKEDFKMMAFKAEIK